MIEKAFGLERSDDHISDLLRKGDVKIYEELFERFYRILCLYARKKVGDIDNARDIVQQVFVRLYEGRDEFRITHSVKSYLFQSVHHACLNFIAQQKRHALHHDQLAPHLPYSHDDDHIVQAELEEKIAIIVAGLPEQCRKIFMMNRYDGKKNSEIAAQLSISVRTVETQISKALSVLRVQLADYLPLLLAVLAI